MRRRIRKVRASHHRSANFTRTAISSARIPQMSELGTDPTPPPSQYPQTVHLSSSDTYAVPTILQQLNPNNTDGEATSTHADLPAVLTPQRSRQNSTPRPLYYKSSSSVSSPTLATAVRSPGTTTPVHRGGLNGQSRRSSGMATSHDGVNPHAAADLLRKAMMHR